MEEILKLIKDRKTDRISFDIRMTVSKENIEKILEAGRWSPTAHNMQNFQIIVIDDQEILRTISSLKRPISETFIRENYQQLSFSEDELLRKKTGILGTMFPEEWKNPDFKLTEELETKYYSQQEKFFPDCPVMFVLLYDPNRRAPASEGDFLGIISLGCATENMWLMANSLGIGFHIISSLGNEPVAHDLKKILNIPENLKIAYCIRLGYPTSRNYKYLRVRRNIEDFTHYNKFGKMGLY